MAADKNSSANVFSGKPKVGGAIFWAPSGTTAPTDGTSALADTFVNVGYISEDGLTEKESRSFEKFKAWGGDIVQQGQTEYEKSYSFKMIEVKEDTLKVRYGAENVEAADGAISIKHNSAELAEGVWVFEIAIGAKVLRKVIGRGVITELEDISYKDGDLIGYGVTLGCLPNDDGDVENDYIAAVA